MDRLSEDREESRKEPMVLGTGLKEENVGGKITMNEEEEWKNEEKENEDNCVGSIEELAVDIIMVTLPSLTVSCPVLALISRARLYDSWSL